jgi:hypothetical protein
MKRITLLLLMLALTICGLQAQNRATKAMSQKQFASYLEEMQMIKTPAGRIAMAMEIAGKEHFYTGQIQEMALMLENDKLRFQFALKAFENAVNPEHYYTVMDAFDLKSTAFRFADAVKQLETNSEDIHIPAAEAPAQLVQIKLPDASAYEGTTPDDCNKVFSDNEFSSLKAQLMQVKSPQGKLKLAITQVKTHCMTVAQVMKMAQLIHNEKLRYDLFASAVHRVYDMENTRAFAQMLQSEALKNKLYAISKPKPKPDMIEEKPAESDCRVPAREMEEILSVLNDIDFESSRMKEAQSIIKRKRCFRTEQIIRMLKTLDYENSRLELAKFAFPYVIDKANYYKVNDIFEFTSSKDDMREFLDGQ